MIVFVIIRWVVFVVVQCRSLKLSMQDMCKHKEIKNNYKSNAYIILKSDESESETSLEVKILHICDFKVMK